MEEGRRIEKEDKEGAMWRSKGGFYLFSTKKEINSLVFWF